MRRIAYPPLHTVPVTDDSRYCSECRAELARGADSCAVCGVYAGDVFDGRMPRRGPPRFRGALLLVLILGVAGAGGWLFFQRRQQSRAPRLDSAPTAVVRQRPGGTRRAAGAKINEAEAIRALRRHFATAAEPVTAECLVVSSQGPSGSQYDLTAIDRCKGTRLGRWVVNGDGVVQKR